MANSKRPAPNEVLAHVDASLSRWLSPGQTAAVGFSGGLDSTVLLHALKRAGDLRGIHTHAVHVHHALSPHADAWAESCRAFCESRQIPFTVERVHVDPRGQGMEAAARAARYATFRAQAADAVVLAHHQDDQAETLLLQLLRGAGLKGLSAMAATRRLGATMWLLRPLLAVPRALLLEYAQRENLAWIEDESNRDTRFARNYLRREVLPTIEARFPAYRRALSRTAQHMAEANALLDAIADGDLAEAADGDCLKLGAVQQWPLERARNALRRWFERQGVQAPNARKLEDILRQMHSRQMLASTAVRLGSHVLRNYRGRLSLELLSLGATQDFSVPWRGETELYLPNGVLVVFRESENGIDPMKLASAPVTVRNRCGGERIKPDCNRPTRTLKNLLQEAGLPPWQRRRLPLVFCGETLVAVPGIGIQCEWRTGSAGIIVELAS